MSQDLYADNVSHIKNKLADLQSEQIANYDAMANNIQQQFSGPTGTLAEYTNKWADVQKFGEGEMLSHMVGKGAIKGTYNIYKQVKNYRKIKANEKEGKQTDPQSNDNSTYKESSDTLEEAGEERQDGESFRQHVERVNKEGDVDGAADQGAAAPEGGTPAPAQPEGGNPAPAQPEPAQPAPAQPEPAQPAPAQPEDDAPAPAQPETQPTPGQAGAGENPELINTSTYDLGTAGGGDAPSVLTGGRNITRTIVRNPGLDTDTPLDEGGSDAFKYLAEKGQTYKKVLGSFKDKVTSMFKSSNTPADGAGAGGDGAGAGGDGAGAGADAGANAAVDGGEAATELTLSDAVFGAVPIIGEVALGISGIVALGDGIAHLFDKPDSPSPPPLVAPALAPVSLTAKYASALPSADSSMDRGASSMSF